MADPEQSIDPRTAKRKLREINRALRSALAVAEAQVEEVRKSEAEAIEGRLRRLGKAELNKSVPVGTGIARAVRLTLAGQKAKAQVVAPAPKTPAPVTKDEGALEMAEGKAHPFKGVDNPDRPRGTFGQNCAHCGEGIAHPNHTPPHKGGWLPKSPEDGVTGGELEKTGQPGLGAASPPAQRSRVMSRFQLGQGGTPPGAKPPLPGLTPAAGAGRPGGYKLPGLKPKAGPPPIPAAAAVTGANRQLAGMKSLASNPTHAAPMGKGEPAIECKGCDNGSLLASQHTCTKQVHDRQEVANKARDAKKIEKSELCKGCTKPSHLGKCGS